jgi:NDP-sugar pyrophosphorylase family protein
MQAILLVSGHAPEIHPLLRRYPFPLLPLVDRPFVQHAVERLAGLGISHVTFILDPAAEQVAAFLGNGSRWGCLFKYHREPDTGDCCALLKELASGHSPDEPILLGHAERLVSLPKGHMLLPPPQVLYYSHRTKPAGIHQDTTWTGWAVLSQQSLAALPKRCERKEFEQALRTVASDWSHSPHCEIVPVMSVGSFPDIIAAHRAVLAGEFPIHPQGREIEPGIWIGRKTRVHPTVQFNPPVAVGDNCLIGAGVRLGPFATLVGDCLLDDHAAVSNSVILPGSYVGPGLDLDDVIVDQKYLIHVREGRTLMVAEDYVLGSLLASPSWEPRPPLLSRAAGVFSPLLTRPIALFKAWRSRDGRPWLRGEHPNLSPGKSRSIFEAKDN